MANIALETPRLAEDAFERTRILGAKVRHPPFALEGNMITVRLHGSNVRPGRASSPITAPRVAHSFRFWSSRAARS
jgi:hypothetical protein